MQVYGVVDYELLLQITPWTNADGLLHKLLLSWRYINEDRNYSNQPGFSVIFRHLSLCRIIKTYYWMEGCKFICSLLQHLLFSLIQLFCSWKYNLELNCYRLQMFALHAVHFIPASFYLLTFFWKLILLYFF